MINSAVIHIGSSLNQFLKRKFDLAEDIAVISNIIEQDGSLVPDTNNKILICLVNIEKESASINHPQNISRDTSKTVSSYPPVHLNLYVMFAANFSGKNYGEALKFLSCTISYFQRNPVFNHYNSPDMDKKIAKLTLDIENLNIKDLSSLWSIIAGKYMPSILYKVRMITYDAKDIKARVPILKTPQTSVNN